MIWYLYIFLGGINHCLVLCEENEGSQVAISVTFFNCHDYVSTKATLPNLSFKADELD